MRDNHNYIYRRGTTPNTRIAVSQKNKLFAVPYGQAAFTQLGVISSFGISESRNVEEVRGMGYGDQLAELVPGVTNAMTLNIDRTLLYLSNIYQTFGYRSGTDGLVRSLKHHQWPFDIKQELVFSRIASRDAVSPSETVSATDGVNEALLTFFEACWIESYGATFSADQALITENIGVKVTDIIDGQSTYGELAADAQSTGNNPFNGETSSVRYSTAGAGVPTNII